MDDGRWWRRICCVRTYRCDYGWGCQLANYGEYSGAPSNEETFTYAKIMFILMTRHRHPDGKFLIIGGAIAKKNRCCIHVYHCDQSSGGFCIGVQGAQHQNVDSTSWSKLPRWIVQDERSWSEVWFVDEIVRPRDSHRCCGARDDGM